MATDNACKRMVQSPDVNPRIKRALAQAARAVDRKEWSAFDAWIAEAIALRKEVQS